MDTPIPLVRQLIEAETRFLYLFTFREESHAQAAEHILEQRHVTAKGEQQRWERILDNECYTRDLLPQIRDFLFGDLEDSCIALRIRAPVAQSLFGNRRLVFASGQLNDPFVAASLPPMGGIELFLSPFGAGVLSIRLRCESLPGSDVPSDLALLQQFNYNLSQLKPGRFPRLLLPSHSHSIHNPDDRSDEDTSGTAKSLSMPDTVALLLECLSMHNPRAIQDQLSVYSVVRLSSSYNLSRIGADTLLLPILSGLAQIEEGLHAGAPTGEITVPHIVFNKCHWAAVSMAGAAHMICDQGPDEVGHEHPFNSQRMSVVRDRYFAVYLLATLQRLGLERFISRASELLPVDESNYSFLKNFRSLRHAVLAFAIKTSTHSVTSRHALNRFYLLATEGVGLKQATADIREVIEHIDECREAIQNSEVVRHQNVIADQLQQNITGLRQMQEEVSILEMFFVAVYATELAKLVADGAGLTPWYAASTAVLWGGLAVFVAWLGLKRWRHRPLRLVALAILILVFASGWIYAGKHWISRLVGKSSDSTRDIGHQPESRLH